MLPFPDTKVNCTGVQAVYGGKKSDSASPSGELSALLIPGLVLDLGGGRGGSVWLRPAPYLVPPITFADA